MFREPGYDATSLSDIARAAQIPVGSLHYHFNSKEELLEQVYPEGQGRLVAAVKTAISDAHHPDARLRAACTAHLRAMCGDDAFLAAVILLKISNVSPRPARSCCSSTRPVRPSSGGSPVPLSCRRTFRHHSCSTPCSAH